MSTRNWIRSSGVSMTSVDQLRSDEPSQESQDVHQEQQDITEQRDDNNGTSKKKGRGMTSGISVEKKRRKSKIGKLDIIIHPLRNRIVGENARHFKTEASTVLRLHAPLKYVKWKQIPIDIKMKIWLAMKQKINLTEDWQVKKVVFEQLNRQYRSYRHKLHMYYLKNKDREDILEQPPDSVKRNDWLMLINCFESDAFKKDSGRNKQNRGKLVMAHTCGTKSIAQYCYEERDPETGEEPSRTSTWRKTRYSNEKKDWADQASREAYEKIIRLQSEPIEDSQYPMSEDEAFIKVLGQEKPSRLRGCGDGLKLPSKRGQRINDELQKENEELRRQSEETSLRLQHLEAQLSNQESQVQAQVQAILNAQLPALLQNLSQTNQVPSSHV